MIWLKYIQLSTN